MRGCVDVDMCAHAISSTAATATDTDVVVAVVAASRLGFNVPLWRTLILYYTLHTHTRAGRSVVFSP